MDDLCPVGIRGTDLGLRLGVLNPLETMSEEAAPYTISKREHLQILSDTIATHARKIAHEEWDKEHWPILAQILGNAKLNGKATLTLEGREVPIELVKRAIREHFLEERAKALTTGLAEQVIETAFKKVIEKEGE
jgi:hypothetical protein